MLSQTTTDSCIQMNSFFQKHSDERLKRSNEMLLGMKLLKLYGWEEMFMTLFYCINSLFSETFRRTSETFQRDVTGNETSQTVWMGGDVL